LEQYLIEKFNRWLGQFEDLSIHYIDNQKLIISDFESKIVVNLENLLKEDYSKYILEKKEALSERIIDYHFKKDDLNLEEDNPKLKKFYCKGFKLGSRAEFFIDYSVLYYESDDVVHSNTFEMDEFKIGEVTVTIGEPSDMFRLIFKQLEDDKYLGDWESNSTIKLKGITNENYKDVLQQALFLLGFCNSSIYDDDYPSIRTFSGKYYSVGGTDEEIIEERKLKWGNQYTNMEFSESKYSEPINFFNSGMRIEGEEISFLYFYKVLEYFFIINYKDFFIHYIDQYNSNKDINKFIENVTGIYKKNEEQLLLSLLKSLETELSPIIKKAYTKGLIKSEELEEFSNELYLYRNSIVHGKGDTRYTLKVTDLIEHDIEMAWVEIVKSIAVKIIFKYCYQNLT
jgi:hypothetical protein